MAAVGKVTIQPRIELGPAWKALARFAAKMRRDRDRMVSQLGRAAERSYHLGLPAVDLTYDAERARRMRDEIVFWQIRERLHGDLDRLERRVDHAYRVADQRLEQLQRRLQQGPVLT